MRKLKNSEMAEEMVIGGLILENSNFENVRDIISANDFYLQLHKILFKGMEKFFNERKPFDAFILGNSLKSEGVKEIDILNILSRVYSYSNILMYAKIVKEKSLLRSLINASDKIKITAENCSDGKSLEVLQNAEKTIFEISKIIDEKNECININKIFKFSLERIDELSKIKNGISGVETGYQKLDKLTSGLQLSDLIVLAARPSMGKTSLAMNIAENVALSGKGVMVFSLEMSSLSLTNRFLSSSGKISQSKIRSGILSENEYKKIGSAISKFSKINLYIDETSDITPSRILSRARRLAKEIDLKLIVVDYIQLMRSDTKSQNRTIEISEITRGLKLAAKELGIPILALSQLNRGVEQRQDRRPSLADLRDSGAIEQDADLIAFIYRDEVYNKDSKSKGIAEIIISKHRNGELGTFPLVFCGKYTRFENPLKEIL